MGLILVSCAVALLAGHDGGYQQADWFLRAIAVAVLTAAGFALWHGSRGRVDS